MQSSYKVNYYKNDEVVMATVLEWCWCCSRQDERRNNFSISRTQSSGTLYQPQWPLAEVNLPSL